MCVNIPAGVSDTVELGTPGTLVSWTELTCSDLSGTPEVTSRSHIPNSFFTVGSTDVTYICIDASGNTESCVFPVTVIAIDTTPPQCVNLPNEISKTVKLGTPGIEISWIEPTCSDISGTASITTRSHTPPSFFSVGMATVSYTCTDLSGNSETCTFPVTVSTAPHNCPENIIVETNVGEQTANVFWKETFENNTVWNKSAYLTASHAPGDDFLLGNTMVLYTFYDADGIIIDSCQFCVTVVSGGMIVGCPRHAIVTSAKGMSTNVTLHNPVVLSDGSPRNLSSLTKVSPGDNFKVGVTRVTYREDKAICRFTIIVKDITPPELVHCTQDILVQLQPGETSSEVNWVVPKARDYESEFVCVQSTHSPGDRFEAGLTTVTYTFSDNAGNEATCKCGVHVARADDTNPPNIVNCPESVLNYEFQEREDNYEVFWRTPTAADDLNLPIAVSSSHSNRDRFPIGSTDVTYIFTDVVGNVATCRFEVYISG
ncbi:Hyalin [Holothuria leucospilota]|uniref:Hyalin n=1 Tax=Holothuria leucospilota TaxID=206669 RepID=A0A9Q1C8C8_HOLLE|nr:Hyalin [Holothuria leucospilota]